MSVLAYIYDFWEEWGRCEKKVDNEAFGLKNATLHAK